MFSNFQNQGFWQHMRRPELNLPIPNRDDKVFTNDKWKQTEESGGSHPTVLVFSLEMKIQVEIVINKAVLENSVFRVKFC